MNTFREFNTSMRFALAALALVFATALAPPSTSHAAGTAAGTKISNIAHVNYNNTAGTAQAQVDALADDVTVTLVPSAVNISPSITTSAVTEGTATVVTYTVFGTANGKDTYSFSSAETASANMSTVSGTITPFALPTLAGTSLAVATTGGEVSIIVPLDSSGSYAATGLVAGAAGTGTLLRIGANTYTVTVITPNGDNTMTLTLNTALAAGTALSVGTPIGEQKIFTVSYPSGVISGAGPSTQTANATVTSTDVTKFSAPANTVITVTSLPTWLTITKTACTTTPAAGLQACFALTGSNAAPGGTVLYKVLITNSGAGFGVAKAVVINDIIQKYLTYNTGSARYGVGAGGTQVTRSYDGTVGGALTALTEGLGGYTYTAGTATVNYAYPVDLANGNELVLFYSAIVN